MRALVAGLAAAVLFAGCGSDQSAADLEPAAPEPSDHAPKTINVSKAEIGKDWPLTVDHGVLSCHETYGIVFTTPDGTEYAVNGTAKSTGEFREIDEIWADDPLLAEYGGGKLNIGPVIDRGLKLCGQP